MTVLRVAQLARAMVGVLVCALVAHFFAYRSLVPGDGPHGYLGWYELLVCALSGAAVVLVGVTVGRALLGRRDRRLRRLQARSEKVSRRGWLVSLPAASLALLAAQETIERSLASGGLEPPSLSLAMWLVALAAVGLVAASIVLVERSCAELIEAALGQPRPALRRPPARAGLPAYRSCRRRRRSVLSELRALRAPPLVAT